MKYTLTVNQLEMKRAGLSLNQWLILDVLSVSPTWAKPIVVEDEVYFWVSRQSISRELEVLDLKPDTIYRHLRKLADDGFVDYRKSGKKDCVRLTQKGKDLFVSTMSEANPKHYVGSKSENTMSEANPTDQDTFNQDTSNHKEKSKKENPTILKKISAIQAELFEKYSGSVIEMKYPLDEEKYLEWIEYRKAKKPVSEKAMRLQIKKLCAYPTDIQAAMIDQSIENDYQGLFELKGNGYRQRGTPEYGSLGWAMQQQATKATYVDTEVSE